MNNDASYTRALDAALRFLANRPRSEHEIRRRLARLELPDATLDRVVAQLRAHHLVDDVAFARYWVEQRQTFRPRGARLLKAELRQHGVSGELAAAVADEGSQAADEDAYRAAHKKARLLAAARPDERVFRTRLAQFLARRGFDWETITPVVDRLWRELRPS